MKRKASKFDFKESSLPSNRKELFFDVLKNNYRVLLKIGLVLIVFSLPLVMALFIKDYMAASFYTSYSTGSYNEEEYMSLISANNLLFNAINSITLGILGIGVAGIIKIVKRLCFLDPVFFMEDFKAGIKDSGKHMFFLFFIFGLIQLFNDYALANANSFVAVIPSCISFTIAYPTFMFMIMALAIYNITFGKCLYVSFMLYIKSALKTLLVYIVALVPFLILLLFNNLVTKYVIFMIELIFIIPILLVGVFDYCCLVFDKQINQTQYPEIYRKGLIDKTNTNK